MSSIARALPVTLREIRFIVSSSRVTQLGLTEYLNTIIPPLYKVNPGLKVLLRECEGVEDYVIFRSAYGREDRFYLEHVDRTNLDQILSQVVADLK